jgi:hypothetical protein
MHNLGQLSPAVISRSSHTWQTSTLKPGRLLDVLVPINALSRASWSLDKGQHRGISTPFWSLPCRNSSQKTPSNCRSTTYNPPKIPRTVYFRLKRPTVFIKSNGPPSSPAKNFWCKRAAPARWTGRRTLMPRSVPPVRPATSSSWSKSLPTLTIHQLVLS